MDFPMVGGQVKSKRSGKVFNVLAIEKGMVKLNYVGHSKIRHKWSSIKAVQNYYEMVGDAND